MRFLHVLFGLLLLVLLAAAAVLVINAALSEDLWTAAVDQVRSARLLALQGAAVLLLVMFLYLLTGIRRSEKPKFITFENEGGTVSISIQAVRDSLARLAEEFASVLSLDPVIHGQSGNVEVEMNVRVKAGSQIPELCRLLQERVRENVQSHLGLPDLKGVKISVQEIVSPPSGKKPGEGTEWEGSVGA